MIVKRMVEKAALFHFTWSAAQASSEVGSLARVGGAASVQGGVLGTQSSRGSLRHPCPAVRGSHRRRVAAQQGARACARRRRVGTQFSRVQRAACAHSEEHGETWTSVQHPQAPAIRRGRRRKRWSPEANALGALLCEHEGALGHRQRGASSVVLTGFAGGSSSQLLSMTWQSVAA